MHVIRQNEYGNYFLHFRRESCRLIIQYMDTIQKLEKQGIKVKSQTSVMQ